MVLRVRLSEENKNQDLPIADSDKGGNAGDQQQGKNLSPEDLKQLSEQIGATIAGALGSGGRPSNDDRQPTHQILGLNNSMAKRLKDKLGEEEFTDLMGVIGSIAEQAQQNDSQIVTALKDISETISNQMQTYNTQLNELQSQPKDLSHMWNVYGFNAFEENKDDLKEALELATEQSGGLVDYVQQFEEAQERDDFQHLSKIKDVIFDPYMQGKYKDHDAVSGGSGRAAVREELKQQEDQDAEYEKLERELALARSNKEHGKALALTQQMKDMLHSAQAA